MKKILLFIFLLSSVNLFAQTWQDTAAQIEKLFARYKPEIPGCQLTIARNGQVIYSKAWGMADLEHKVPLTTSSVIEAGSVSKQFTAAAILLLEQQGKLSLKDDVRKHIPELPDYGHVITLEQMMRHTSGLRDWGSIASLTGWPRSTKTYSNEDALFIATRQKELNHIPGAEYLYSNTNYNLFAIIVQRVSGKSLSHFSNEYIFKPAGMKQTQWRDNFKKIVPDRAMAYVRSVTGYLTEMPNEYVYGNGGLLTTTEDLAKWTTYWSTGQLGGPSLLDKQLYTIPLNNGVANFYAAGLGVSNRKGWKMISHDGATAGYRANLEFFPETGLTIAWLSNTAEFDGSPVNLFVQLSDVFLKAKTPEEGIMDPTEKPQISPSSFAPFTGWYRDPRTGGAFRLYLKDDKLFASPANLLAPVTANMAVIGSRHLIFTGQTMRSVSRPGDTIVYAKVDSAIISNESLGQYEGQYYSEEADATYSVTVKNGALVMEIKPVLSMTLTPTYKDAFSMGGIIVYFERGKKDKIEALRVSVGRARNVKFVKVIK